MKIKEFSSIIEKKFPKNTAESYDNVGLLVGNKENEISKILVTLDVTLDVIDEAINKGCNLIFSHHPIIFRKISSVTTDSLVGKKLLKLIQNDISVYSAHTNLDACSGGLNDLLSSALGISNLLILEENSNADLEAGIGRYGVLDTKKTIKDVIENIKSSMGINSIRYSGNLNDSVKRVAILNGSGQSLFESAKRKECDLIITGDTSHHFVSDFSEEGINVIDMGHFESEWLPFKMYCKTLKEYLDANGIELIEAVKSVSPYKSY